MSANTPPIPDVIPPAERMNPLLKPAESCQNNANPDSTEESGDEEVDRELPLRRDPASPAHRRGRAPDGGMGMALNMAVPAGREQDAGQSQEKSRALDNAGQPLLQFLR
jgi:hypothetical protein